MMKKQTALVAIFAAAATFASVVAAGAQTLAEVAQKEAARRKDVKAPVKVFTNDSIKRVPPAAPQQTPPADAAPQPAAPAAGAAGEAVGEKPPEALDPQKDPEHWRKRITDARQARDRNAFLLEAVQSRINGLTTDFYARDDPYQRSQIELERNKALRELDLMKKQQIELEQKIAAIEEEARRANVPPGWLR